MTATSALEPTGAPVFVLAGGGRTGSTLVPRWGFKEIRDNGAAISLLNALFPDAAIVVLVRHPEAMLGSIKVRATGDLMALRLVARHAQRQYP